MPQIVCQKDNQALLLKKLVYWKIYC